MSAYSKIEWTESSWNPTTGCTKISLGCQNCYAMRMAHRLKEMGQAKYKNGFRPTVHPDVLSLPFRWKKPRIIFVSSMGDLFHEKIPTDFIKKTFDVMRRADHHLFQVLTKRSERLLELSTELPWPDNVWMGVTVESNEYQYRIGHLGKTPARIRFLSLEPLLGPIPSLALDRIGWVIVGGESGPGARPMKREWVVSIRDQCRERDVAFFFKQWGGVNKKKTGRVLDGRVYSEMPEPERIRAQYALF
jgi:protein gp37